MMKIRMAILDDEQIHIDRMKKVIEDKTLNDGKDILIDEYLNSIDFLSSDKKYDIVLIDMQLENAEEGLVTAKEFRRIQKEAIIIFVTLNEEMSRAGYEVNALRYVYKANLQNELKEALEAAFNIMAQNIEMNINIANLGEGDIRIKDIVYIETRKPRKLIIHLDNREIILNENMSKFTELLEIKDFVSPHQSFIVNLNYYDDIVGDEILLKTGEKIKVSRNRMKETKEKIVSWLVKRM